MKERDTDTIWQRLTTMVLSVFAATAISALLAILLWAARYLTHG
jgi:hypothetical protein